MPRDLPRAKQGAMYLPLPEAPQTGGSGEGVQHPRMGASVKSRVVRMLLGLYQPSGVSSCPVKVVAEGRRGRVSVGSRWGHAARSGSWLPVWDSLGWQSGTELGKPPDTTQMMSSNPRAEFKYLSPAFTSWDYLEDGLKSPCTR